MSDLTEFMQSFCLQILLSLSSNPSIAVGCILGQCPMLMRMLEILGCKPRYLWLVRNPAQTTRIASLTFGGLGMIVEF